MHVTGKTFTFLFLMFVWAWLNLYFVSDLVLFAQLQESWERVGKAANFRWLEIKYYFAPAFRTPIFVGLRAFSAVGGLQQRGPGTLGESPVWPCVLAVRSHCCWMVILFLRLTWLLLQLVLPSSLKVAVVWGKRRIRRWNQTNFQASLACVLAPPYASPPYYIFGWEISQGPLILISVTRMFIKNKVFGMISCQK